MKTPLHTIIAQLRRLSLDAQIEKLMALAAAEKPHSIRRAELLSMLQEKRTRDLRRNARARAKARSQAA